MWSNPQEIADLVTFTEEILIGKLHFLYSDYYFNVSSLKGQKDDYDGDLKLKLDE